MSTTLTIRLDDRDREVLEDAARKVGRGISSFVRDLAHEEADRLRRAEIRAQGERVVSYLAHSPEARAELELYGTPVGEPI